MQKLNWQKYLTREYSFLYISYAADCYRRMKKLTGATIKYDLAHGRGCLVSLYGIMNDFERCYRMIGRRLAKNPKWGHAMMNKFENLQKNYFILTKKIKKQQKGIELKELLFVLDKIFLDILSYYLYFVYLGYGGDKFAIGKFLKRNKKRFENIRNSGIDTYMDKEFPKLFGKYNRKSQPLISYMSRKDLLDFLSDRRLDLRKIRSRKKEYLLVTRNGVTKEYILAGIKKTLDKELAHLKSRKKQESIKGKIACKGRVKGHARLIFTQKDYAKIRKEDIIITPMTKPNIERYLSRVKGIVTNDGGALSHASIISRERKIPCIVGTKNATDIIKDGNLIELDADTGVVKMLK